jgi:DNA-binding transcriptional ArsR family regulator
MYSDHTIQDQRLAWHANLLSQLANPSRLQVCIFLSNHEEDVNSLARKIGISQPALSRHLSRLHQSGIVKVRRQAQFKYYSCDHPNVLELLKTLTEIYSPDLGLDKA